MATPTPHTAPAGLRERKKQRTRDALIRAALELFTEQGYETTTIDEIAEAVDVSQRTYFRYFANKEDVAFAVQETVEARFLEALAARPAAEAPLTALRSAVTVAWDDIGDAIESVIPVELYMRSFRMIESTPALIAAHLRRSSEMEEQIARLIARREGLDMDTDPRPRVLVAAFGGVMRVAGQVWGEGQECSVASIRELTKSYLDHIGPAMEDDWRAR
ncbi:TetR/AcrR family transcriptional regulator [Streptomyces lydicamycinicus]|uniref:Putative TetR family transcriptional regulator n=1 Tax=Streptomyces lydicamycinicus TaxID=1546107 RepID=A0A0P4R659_9ACTN|nr:TetR/AcrR family transcriptional regulator [Streptomyces lydicamycinicus]USA03344.1 TetR/AcrR family transcriptional regulator [Streptomyces lydicamycinicus]GAO08594.1 putative TetR family transcriptional regulator [Streptomyces lydicamycinicus]